FRLDHPDSPPPASLDALVPGYLASAPADPFGRGPLRVKAEGGDVRVYSVGPDGVDDGGAPHPPVKRENRDTVKGDVTLGSSWTPGPGRAGGSGAGRAPRPPRPSCGLGKGPPGPPHLTRVVSRRLWPPIGSLPADDPAAVPGHVRGEQPGAGVVAVDDGA